MPKRSWWSGDTVQMMAVKGGRRRSSSRPPASASAMRSRLRASRSSLMETTIVCLLELRTQASNSCRTRVSAGQSWAETIAEVAETFVIAWTTRAVSTRSLLRDGRTVPSSSRRNTPQPSELR